MTSGELAVTDGRFRRLPAVTLTAFARVEDPLSATGVNMHVPKPVEPLELTMVIASLISR
jgi:CheY-like chemotaxis protein